MSGSPPGDPSSNLWRADMPPQFPVPLPDEKDPSAYDPWLILSQTKKTEIDEKCGMWVGEIENLLTFAGLFSAVVAGFLAATYSSLSVNPVDVNTFVLAQVALRLDVSLGLANATSITPLSLNLPFEPSPSLVRVHILWFLSLALSLSMAVIGILCLQWIREYQRPPLVPQGRQSFVVFTMRSESFDRWWIPTIIAFLPVALQVSLVLFFLGDIYFLFPLGTKIAIPTTVVIGLTLAFIAFTTATPVLHPVFAQLTKAGDLPHRSCAYQSPQSRHFPGLIILILYPIILLGCTVVTSFIAVSNLIQRALAEPNMTPEIIIQLVWSDWILLLLDLSEYFPDLLRAELKVASGPPGYMADRMWLDVQDSAHISAKPPAALLRAIGRPRAAQDPQAPRPRTQREWTYAIQGLTTIPNLTPSQAYAVYRCAQGLPTTVISTKGLPKPMRGTISLISDFNDGLWDRRLLACWRDPPEALRRIEFQVLMLNTFPGIHDETFGHGLAVYQLELYIRLLGGIYTGVQLEGDATMGPWMELDPNSALPCSLKDLFVPKLLRVTDDRRCGGSFSGSGQFITQLAHILLTFVEKTLDHSRVNGPPPLDKYHRLDHISLLPRLTIQAFAAFVSIKAQDAPQHEALPAMLRIFTQVHHLLSSHLTAVLSNGGGVASSPILLPLTRYYVSMCLDGFGSVNEGGLRITWAATSMLRDRPNTPVIERYMASFEAMLQHLQMVLQDEAARNPQADAQPTSEQLEQRPFPWMFELSADEPRIDPTPPQPAQPGSRPQVNHTAQPVPSPVIILNTPSLANPDPPAAPMATRSPNPSPPRASTLERPIPTSHSPPSTHDPKLLVEAAALPSPPLTIPSHPTPLTSSPSPPSTTPRLASGKPRDAVIDIGSDPSDYPFPLLKPATIDGSQPAPSSKRAPGSDSKIDEAPAGPVQVGPMTWRGDGSSEGTRAAGLPSEVIVDDPDTPHARPDGRLGGGGVDDSDIGRATDSLTVVERPSGTAAPNYQPVVVIPPENKKRSE